MVSALTPLCFDCFTDHFNTFFFTRAFLFSLSNSKAIKFYASTVMTGDFSEFIKSFLSVPCGTPGHKEQKHLCTMDETSRSAWILDRYSQ